MEQGCAVPWNTYLRSETEGNRGVEESEMRHRLNSVIWLVGWSGLRRSRSSRFRCVQERRDRLHNDGHVWPEVGLVLNAQRCNRRQLKIRKHHRCWASDRHTASLCLRSTLEWPNQCNDVQSQSGDYSQSTDFGTRHWLITQVTRLCWPFGMVWSTGFRPVSSSRRITPKL